MELDIYEFCEYNLLIQIEDDKMENKNMLQLLLRKQTYNHIILLVMWISTGIYMYGVHYLGITKHIKFIEHKLLSAKSMTENSSQNEYMPHCVTYMTPVLS